MVKQLVWGVCLLAVSGCSASRAQAVRGSGELSSPAATVAAVERRYVDESLGFEVVRPSGDWQLTETDDYTEDGLAIPVVLRHASGAQVVLQIAPAVATPTQFAERITVGLERQPGFQTSDLMPLPLSDSAVGFDFTVNDEMDGKVAVREGAPGSVFMVMGTWPRGAPASVAEGVDAIIRSVRPVSVRLVRAPSRGALRVTQ